MPEPVAMRVVLALLSILALSPPSFAATGLREYGAFGRSGAGNGQFRQPQGVAVDTSGNVYVADMQNHRIQKLTWDGTCLASWGGALGSDLGQFSYPRGVAVDTSGNVYVADTENSRIQKLTVSTGVWSVVDAGYLSRPFGVAVDASGNLYVADTNDNRIQVFDASGALTGSWGTDSSRGYELFGPVSVAVDNSGNVYVADAGHDRIVKLAADGTLLDAWGSTGAGNGQFSAPYGVAVDGSGNVYVTDQGNKRVQKRDTAGVWISYGISGYYYGQFKSPIGVAVDASGYIYVSDQGNAAIKRLALDGAGLGVLTDAQISQPKGVAVDRSGNIYVPVNNKILKLPWATGGAWTAVLTSNLGHCDVVAVDASNNIYTICVNEGTQLTGMTKLSSNGTILGSAGPSMGNGNGQLFCPQSLAVDSSGNIFESEYCQYRLQKFSASMNWLANWQFVAAGLATDASGNIYAADSAANAIGKYSSDILPLASWGSYGSGNGQFYNPRGVAVDASGNVYVADTGNNRMQKLSADGSWLATWGSYGSGMGQYSNPSGVAVDANGNVFVADYANNRIQFGFPGPTASLVNPPDWDINQSSLSLTVGGAGVTQYKYRLDNGAWSDARPVATPIALTLANDYHSLEVIGADQQGRWQILPNSTFYDWFVDAPLPARTTFTGQPASLTNTTGASITIGNGGGTIAYYRWSLDGVNWSDPIAVSMLLTLYGLGDGSHTLYLESRDVAGNWQATPTTYTWTVDTTAPTATLINPPPAIGNSANLTLNVMAGDVTTYQYALDAGAYGVETPVGTPIALNNLADGSHSLLLVGKDAAGNWQAQAQATAYAFTVDTVAPVAIISGAPTNPTNATTATLTISGNDVATYQYQLDAAGYSATTPVATPIALTNLGDGSHIVSVLGTDAAGNTQSQPTTATWVVDTAAPTAVVAGTPGSPTSSNTAVLDVSGDGVVQYKYKLDDGAYSTTAIDVGTDIALANLPDGGHMVSVLGADAAGNWQSQASPTTVSWVVDTLAPTASLAGVPASPTNSNAATITVAGDGVNTYQYGLDNGNYGDEMSIATKITLSSLADGSHTLNVKGRDLAGNWQQTPTSATWIVDTQVPLAVLSGAPNGATNATTANITVSGNDVASYKYKLDTADYGSQTPVATPISLSNLADGSHTLSVLGGNAAGTWQVSPTTATWTVNTTAPTPTVSGVPTSPSNSPTASITVGGPNVTDYQYKLDTGSWNPKTSVANTIELADLFNGSHTLYVIGCNSLGTCQSQATPVTATWTVDTVAPETPTISTAQNPTIRTTAQPTLFWTSVSDASSYRIEVADNSGFNAPLVQKSVTGTTSYTLAASEALTHKGSWFWRVQAKDAAGNVSNWASASFTYRTVSNSPVVLLLQYSE